MKKMILVLFCFMILCSAACAGDYVYIVPYRYRLPNIMYSYDPYYRMGGSNSYYRMGGSNPYYEGSLYQRSLLYPPMYNMIDDFDDDDNYGFMVDPYGGMWFYYNKE